MIRARPHSSAGTLGGSQQKDLWASRNVWEGKTQKERGLVPVLPLSLSGQRRVGGRGYQYPPRKTLYVEVESFHPRRLPARRAHSRAPRAIDYDRYDRYDRPDNDSRWSPGNPPRVPRKASKPPPETPGIKMKFRIFRFFQICSYIDFRYKP